ncbi:class I SAM-dependent methyltransferase [Zavarzinia compransoris]|uniref:Class I SAM-dependent methyltransferase n=1 Tax=Zavarzinia compransoris TaxID=1264899 RepID=A0A317E126_9PROT|nr:methyltransferase domain-containing protein [Zavarzinia compransoris]PWR19826.1 class I SAM-dependent methyltransferase [Zavarzinia compransoris]TDP45067.1 hypothetical protein DES42_106289 [Zavarzinia compransoris]
MSPDQIDIGAVFARKYEADDEDWGRSSGPGSDAFYNIPYRGFLEAFIRLNGIGSIVDIGCGDWQFSRYVNFRGARYLGLDVVESVVARNKRLFSSANVDFAVAPPGLEALPAADLLIMKDVLQHLPSPLIMRYRDEVFPRFRYALITNSYRKLDTPSNVDIEVGGFRCLDLTQAPFSIRAPYVLQFGVHIAEELRTLLIHNPAAAPQAPAAP